MSTTTIKIVKLRPDAVLPTYAHGPSEDAGMDLYTTEDVMLHPGMVAAISTGISIELPPGFEAQIRPRSGLASKFSITVANSPGTVDPSFRGEIKVLLINHGRCFHEFSKGDRIAQLIIARYEAVRWEECEELAESGRGVGGFGSSGR